MPCLTFTHCRENGFIDIFRLRSLSPVTACKLLNLILFFIFSFLKNGWGNFLSISWTSDWLVKTLQTLLGIVFFGTMLALLKVMFLCKARYSGGVVVAMPMPNSNEVNKNEMCLTKHQLELLGVKPKVDLIQPESLKKPPKSKPQSASSDLLVPLHQPIPTPSPSRRVDADGSNSNRGATGRPIGTPSRSPGSSSLYLAPGVVSPTQGSAGVDSVVSSPWSNRRASSANKITSEEKLEQFLAEVDERITESAGKLSTPPPSIPGFGIVSPNAVSGSANTSGTKRLTPLRPVRMSPGSQKFNTPPKKGEGDLPPPMSMEESIEAFEHLGVYPQIEQWRDQLRQWFSSVLLNPLLHKIETSHVQVHLHLHHFFLCSKQCCSHGIF